VLLATDRAVVWAAAHREQRGRVVSAVVTCVPPDVTVAVVLAGRVGVCTFDGWLAADEVAVQLGELGFDRSAQQLAAQLHRMSRAGLVERRDHLARIDVYRLTEQGRDLVAARLPRLALRLPWLPAYRSVA